MPSLTPVVRPRSSALTTRAVFRSVRRLNVRSTLSPFESKQLRGQHVPRAELSPGPDALAELLDDIPVLEGGVLVLDDYPGLLRSVRDALARERSGGNVPSAPVDQALLDDAWRIADDDGRRPRRLQHGLDRLANAEVVRFLGERGTGGGQAIAERVLVQRIERSRRDRCNDRSCQRQGQGRCGHWTGGARAFSRATIARLMPRTTSQQRDEPDGRH